MKKFIAKIGDTLIPIKEKDINKIINDFEAEPHNFNLKIFQKQSGVYREVLMVEGYRKIGF